MIHSTTNTIQGKELNEYLGVVTGEAIMGSNIFKDFFANIRERFVCDYIPPHQLARPF